MSRRAPTRHPKTASAAASEPAAQVIDAEVLECLELFALLLVRCNVPRDRAIQHFTLCMDQLPANLGSANTGDDGLSPHVYVPADVLTLWHVSPKWVGPDGQPRALPATGSSASFALLVREVDSKADSQQVLKYLLGIRAVIRVGKKYLPIERKARHRLSGARLRAFNFRASLALLRVVESNVREGRARQYQFTSDGAVPEHRLADFREAMTDLADSTLFAADDEMVRESHSSPPGSRPVPMTLGVFLGEARALPSLISQRGRRSAPKATRRK